MSLIRYPGSKAKLLDPIMSQMPQEMLGLWSCATGWEYREPFFGAGAVGFRMLEELSPKCPVWLNDKDPWMVALWRAVREQPVALQRAIAVFVPTAEAFYEFKATDGSDLPIVEAGFRKLALHQMSMSGFGAKSGGPLGGRDQRNAAYPVDCRWNPQRLKRDVHLLHKLLTKFPNLKITCGDFGALLESAPQTCFTYLDPPYVQAGKALYKYNMESIDHTRLADALRGAQCQWLVSYDEHPLVRSLYDWAEFLEIDVKYSNAVLRATTRPKNRELLIRRPD